MESEKQSLMAENVQLTNERDTARAAATPMLPSAHAGVRPPNTPTASNAGAASSAGAASTTATAGSVASGGHTFALTGVQGVTTARGPASAKEERSTLAQATKIIKVRVSETTDIVRFMTETTKLKGQIDTHYSDVTEELKIKIAMQLLSDKLNVDAELIFNRQTNMGMYDLNIFFESLRKQNFPASITSLDLGYRRLSQSHPERTTIVDYSRTFKQFIQMLKLDIQSQIPKFVEGLISSEVKSALRRHNLESFSFDYLVTMAVSIENNLTLEKTTTRTLVGQEEGWEEIYGGGLGADEAFLVMGVPIKKYFNKADEGQCSNRCFNCLNFGHKSVYCENKKCKFCEVETAKCKHYSILCPKGPRDFKKYMEKRREFEEKFKNRKQTMAKLVGEVEDWQFEDSEFE